MAQKNTCGRAICLEILQAVITDSVSFRIQFEYWKIRIKKLRIWAIFKQCLVSLMFIFARNWLIKLVFLTYD